MIARMPPTNMEASPCTRAMAESGANQRGPTVPCTRWRALSPSGPATLRNSSAPMRSRRVTLPRLAKDRSAGAGRQVARVDDPVGVALFGEEALAVLGEVGVDGVAR